MTYEDRPLHTIRQKKRDQIVNFFLDNIGKPIDTNECHMRFGPSFRSRLSEINRDAMGRLTVTNSVKRLRDGEKSVYVASLKEID